MDCILISLEGQASQLSSDDERSPEFSETGGGSDLIRPSDRDYGNRDTSWLDYQGHNMREWDDMDDDEWAAFEDQLYQEQVEELKQTVRVTTPFIARQIGVMIGLSLCRFFLRSFLGIQAPVIPKIGEDVRRYYVSEHMRRMVLARKSVFYGERQGFANLQ
uniref:Uncharacterized protein n=1 Tax=Spongospora subterranea TaxID=70186 RepID=A0A0H5R769_9EUKA|eukprot:CRZ09985.1 hypothetical protein [Spongospora subterranea]